MAWMIAAMGASVNEPRNGELRWPLVPKLTSWVGPLRAPSQVLEASSRRLRIPLERTEVEPLAGVAELQRCNASTTDGSCQPTRTSGESRCLSNGWHHPTSPIGARGSGYRAIGDAIGLALFD